MINLYTFFQKNGCCPGATKVCCPGATKPQPDTDYHLIRHRHFIIQNHKHRQNHTVIAIVIMHIITQSGGNGNCCAKALLGPQPDFRDQKKWLREVIECAGHRIIYFPEFHVVDSG